MARTTVDDLTVRILQKIQDDSIDSDFVLESINQCNEYIATVIDIKELSTVSELTLLAGDSSIAMPVDFHKNFVFAFNKTIKLPIKVFESRRLIDRKMSKTGTVGNVMVMCNDHPNIYYQYSPSSDQVVDVYYHRLPTAIVDSGVFPLYIPNGHIYKLFFNYVVSQAYDFIEDGIDGGPEDKKTNTTYHEEKFEKALKEFKMFIGPDPDVPAEYNNNSNFDFMD